MTAAIKGYTVGIGLSDEGPVYRVPMHVGAAGGETTVWAVHDASAYPTFTVVEDIVLTHP